MQRRNFVKLVSMLSALPLFGTSAATTGVSTTPNNEIYEWRIYTLQTNHSALDNFFEKTLIPAYNRQQIKVGAFTPYKKGEVEQRFYLFIYPDISTYYKVKNTIWEDSTFRKEAQPFYDETAPNPVYSHFETYLCVAFDKIPTLCMPGKERTLLELRTYCSPNEEANHRKIKMFNKEEIDIFDKVGIQPVCYGDILAGPQMPALMYLTWYKNETTRNEAWSNFGKHPDWIRIKDLPEYAHTATLVQSQLLSPLPYSQI